MFESSIPVRKVFKSVVYTNILYSDPDPCSYVHSDLTLDPISTGITLNFDPL